MKELKVGESLKVVKGGVLVYNTKTGVIVNVPADQAEACFMSPVLHATASPCKDIVPCPWEDAGGGPEPCSDYKAPCKDVS